MRKRFTPGKLIRRLFTSQDTKVSTHTSPGNVCRREAAGALDDYLPGEYAWERSTARERLPPDGGGETFRLVLPSGQEDLYDELGRAHTLLSRRQGYPEPELS